MANLMVQYDQLGVTKILLCPSSATDTPPPTHTHIYIYTFYTLSFSKRTVDCNFNRGDCWYVKGGVGGGLGFVFE